MSTEEKTIKLPKFIPTQDLKWVITALNRAPTAQKIFNGKFVAVPQRPTFLQKVSAYVQTVQMIQNPEVKDKPEEPSVDMPMLQQCIAVLQESCQVCFQGNIGGQVTAFWDMNEMTQAVIAHANLARLFNLYNQYIQQEQNKKEKKKEKKQSAVLDTVDEEKEEKVLKNSTEKE